MKLDESFRDLKNLLGLEKLMNKKREPWEKMLALVLLAYGVGLLVGEALRAAWSGGKKHKRSSGLFILLKHRVRLGWDTFVVLLQQVWEPLRRIVHGNVRTQV